MNERNNGMAKFVVFEGGDGSGKTGIAYALNSMMSGTHIHSGPPMAGHAAKTWDGLITYAAYDSVCPVIFDRLHWGEYVYGSLFRVPELGLRDVIEMNDRILDSGGELVYVKCNVAERVCRAMSRTGTLGLYEEEGIQPRVNDLYDEIYEASIAAGQDVTVIDTSKHIIKYLDLMELNATIANTLVKKFGWPV